MPIIDHTISALDMKKDAGSTPLHFASGNGHVQVVQFLVEHGTDATARDKNGSTPLHLASQNGHVEVAQFLVEHGADAAARDKNGSTPSYLALQNRHREVWQFLVEHERAQSKDGLHHKGDQRK